MADVVGRDAELETIEAFLDRAELPRVALAIVGEPGIGKTTLWNRAVESARARGSTVLVSRPAESEAKLSFAGLTDLLTTVAPGVFASIPAPQRAALETALLRAPASRVPEPRLLGTALLSLLRALAAETEVVVAIDDLHWLDIPSAAAARFALRRVEGERVRAIFSIRAGEEHAADLGREPSVQQLELGPLSVASLHRVLLHELGRSFPRPTLVRIAMAAKGNPLYAIEVARLIDAQAATAELPVPDTLGSLVTARVRSLPRATRDALLRAAALARPTVTLLDADALGPAEEAGLVRIRADGRIEFVHPLFATAVYGSASTSRRRTTHAALAVIVDEPEERVRHVALGSVGDDESLAADLEAAAETARRRGAPETAAELVELALRHVPATTRRADELRLRLAELLHLASDFARSRALLDELRGTLEPGDLRARALLTLAEIDYWHGGESVATTLAEEALADAGDPVVQARCHVAIAMWAGTVDLPKAAAAARDALRVLESTVDADPGLVAAALSAQVRADLFLGAGFDKEKAMRALAAEEAEPPAAVDTRLGFKLGQWLRYVDDFDGARARLVQAEREARDEGDESSLANILLNRVVLETWSGDWSAAADLAERMYDAFGQQGLGPEVGILWRLYVDAHAGNVESVRAGMTAARPEEPMLVALWSRSLGLAELAVGATADAERHLLAALEVFDRIDFREPAIWRVDGDAIEAAVAVGDVDRIKPLVARFEASAARTRVPWSLAVSARCRGLVRAAEGNLEGANESLDHALGEHDRCPMPFERARTLLVHGQVLRRLKQKRKAREALEGAEAIFARIGADVWRRTTAAELQRVAVRRAPSGLSPTELQIARLAADGLTNREIADRAFVTVNTVEANLKRVYSKLGVRSRAQVARALDKLGATPIS